MQYYSTTEAAQLLGVYRSTIVRWIKKGHLAAETDEHNNKNYKISHVALISLKINQMLVASSNINAAIELLFTIEKKLANIYQKQQEIIELTEHIKLEDTSLPIINNSPNTFEVLKKLM